MHSENNMKLTVVRSRIENNRYILKTCATLTVGESGAKRYTFWFSALFPKSIQLNYSKFERSLPDIFCGIACQLLLL